MPGKPRNNYLFPTGIKGMLLVWITYKWALGATDLLTGFGEVESIHRYVIQ
jgi:hypothetical protein